MRRIALFLALFSISCPSLPSGPRQARAATDSVAILHVGDPAPPLDGGEWFAAGSPVVGGRKHAGSAPVTVLMFWASWDPVSREVLARQEELRRSLAGRVRFLAVTPETAAEARACPGMRRWTHLEIACDPGSRLLDSWYEASWIDAQTRGFPFAFVTARSGTGEKDRILWMGPVVDRGAPDPLASFVQVVRDAAAGTYDLAAAIARDRRDSRRQDLVGELRKITPESDPVTLTRLLAEADTLLPKSAEVTPAAIALNGIAWEMATREGRTDEQLALARRAIDLALACGGGAQGSILDTQARVLFEQGNVKEACDVETRALARMDSSGVSAQERGVYVEALQKYRRALGLPEAAEGLPASAKSVPATAEGAPATARDVAGSSTWIGTLNEAHDVRSPIGPTVVVFPVTADARDDSLWKVESTRLSERFFKDCTARRSSELTEEDRTHPLVLYGSPGTNGVTAEILEQAGITLEPEGVRFGGTLLPSKSPVLITALANPWNPAVPAVVYTALDPSQAHNLNAFFHGPTAVLVGSWDGKRPVARWSLDYAAPESDGPRRLALAPDSLSGADLAEDLQALQEQLLLGYAGYPDLDDALAARGSSWSARTDSLVLLARARTRWSWADGFDLVRTYLAPVQDVHFGIEGSAAEGDSCIKRRAGFIRMFSPFFTDLRARRDGDRYLVQEAPNPAWVGREIRDAALIGSPVEVRAGVPALFPTLAPKSIPPAPGTAASMFLCGVLADPKAPPDSITILLGAERTRVPVHRGRVPLAHREDSFALDLAGGTALPVLSVRTMDSDLLRGLAATADSLRDLPRVILDLRGNGGGSDAPAMSWCLRMSRQRFRMACGVGGNPSGKDLLTRWRPAFAQYLEPTSGPQFLVASRPYSGTLFIVIDKGVASSGETMTHLAGQIPGAILLGENSAGCVSYGNVGAHPPLPHSGIVARFGRTKFVPGCVRPTAEGVGFFPDWWLDEPDPVGLLRAACATSRP